jgi:hypothetical protein
LELKAAVLRELKGHCDSIEDPTEDVFVGFPVCITFE